MTEAQKIAMANELFMSQPEFGEIWFCTRDEARFVVNRMLEKADALNVPQTEEDNGRDRPRVETPEGK